jgi:hypothetical protein
MGTTRPPPPSIHFTYDAGKYEMALKPGMSLGTVRMPMIGLQWGARAWRQTRSGCAA